MFVKTALLTNDFKISQQTTKDSSGTPLFMNVIVLIQPDGYIEGCGLWY